MVWNVTGISLEIDLESVSSYSDDDFNDDSLSDCDYIIVPMPDCFDLSKPLRDLNLSSYSNSVADRSDYDYSLDDNHNDVTNSECEVIFF
ncbi:hypothetical protein DPMN_183979 [Dreissena polymorpha]|uniref:Uncharacterized protein n=1 Tax=Dreissena polymorpha TaxID=45954 RepID=A0A9D4DI02_DREPO|nr:hypothetical protein DPMN_183979 [Dreissena polymorpha]